MPDTSIGYPALDLGLNNQKLALLGLFDRARAEQRPLVLPRFSLFDPMNAKHPSVPLDDVFEEHAMRRFAARFGIELRDGAAKTRADGWACFGAGAERVGRDGLRGMAAIDGFVCQFFGHLVPRVSHTPAFSKLRQAVFDRRDLRTVIQMRIEKDWIAYARNSLNRRAGDGEDHLPSFQEIMTKVVGTPDLPSKSAYVVCDEASLPVGKDEIRAIVSSRYGIDLVWKSDILAAPTLDALSKLELSIIDFEMAVIAPYFVGLSRSTFSNLALFEAVCRRRHPVTTHFIYNLPGPVLGRRLDCGARDNPLLAVRGLHAREPLLTPTEDDCRWPAMLVAHVSRVGDVISEASPMVGMHGGPLVCGVRGGRETLIEGFSLDLLTGLGVGVEYRARLHDGSWSDWVGQRGFAGTRGVSRPITGLAVRLVGQNAPGVSVRGGGKLRRPR